MIFVVHAFHAQSVARRNFPDNYLFYSPFPSTRFMVGGRRKFRAHPHRKEKYFVEDTLKKLTVHVL